VIFIKTLLHHTHSYADNDRLFLTDIGKMTEEKDNVIKVVLLGDSGVGKSSLVLRFVTNEFRPYSESTIGASFMSKKLTILVPPVEKNNKHSEHINEDSKIEEDFEDKIEDDDSDSEQSRFCTINFKIWDTAGQEKYHSLAPLYYRGAGAAILVFDICSQVSFESLKKWVDELNINGPAGMMLILCGNKCDLKEHRQVDIHDAQKYAQSVDAFYIETSCRDNINVEQIFKYIGSNLVRTHDDVIAMEEDLNTIDFGVNDQIKSQSWVSMC
jgi:Ras-related protein Rab-22